MKWIFFRGKKWVADKSDMKLITKFNKRVQSLLSAYDY